MKMKLANDLGNGSVKATIDGQHLIFPSVIARIGQTDVTDPVVFNNKRAERAYFNELLDHLKITVSSSAVNASGSYYYGKAAVENSNNLIGFDINDYDGKSETDLAVILTLGLIAGKRAQEAFEADEDLSEPLSAEVEMTTALPISEGKKPGLIKNYNKRFLDRTHTVTIDNFTDPIVVQIKFEKVFTVLEGEAAHFYIRNAEKEVKDGILRDFMEYYPEEAKEISAEDLVSTPNAISLDIGSDTVDVVVIRDGKAQPTSSLSAHQGFGWVLEEAIQVLQANKINFDDRIKLQEYLDTMPSPLEKKRKQRVERVVQDQVEPLADKIVKTVSQVVRGANSDVNVIFVHGGGSIPMGRYSNLRAKLSEKLKSFTGGDDFYVVFVPAEAAQYCNERGLVQILNSITR